MSDKSQENPLEPAATSSGHRFKCEFELELELECVFARAFLVYMGLCTCACARKLTASIAAPLDDA